MLELLKFKNIYFWCLYKRKKMNPQNITSLPTDLTYSVCIIIYFIYYSF